MKKSLILELGTIKEDIARMRFATRWKSGPAASIFRAAERRVGGGQPHTRRFHAPAEAKRACKEFRSGDRRHQETGRGSGWRLGMKAESPRPPEDVVLIAEETRVFRTLISEAEIRSETACADMDRFRLIFLLQGEFGVKRVPGLEFMDVESASKWLRARFPCIKLTRILPDGQRFDSRPPQQEPARREDCE
jgi:hypothetical protein